MVYSEEYIVEKIGVKKPVLMIDSIDVDVIKRTAISMIYLNTNYFFWDCHFVAKPVMPGTYMVEMMAQSAAFLEMLITGCDVVPIISSISGVRFIREIIPNSLVNALIEIKDVFKNYYTSNCKVLCDDKLCAKAEIVHVVSG